MCTYRGLPKYRCALWVLNDYALYKFTTHSLTHSSMQLLCPCADTFRVVNRSSFADVDVQSNALCSSCVQPIADQGPLSDFMASASNVMRLTSTFGYRSVGVRFLRGQSAVSAASTSSPKRKRNADVNDEGRLAGGGVARGESGGGGGVY